MSILIIFRMHNNNKLKIIELMIFSFKTYHDISTNHWPHLMPTQNPTLGKRFFNATNVN